MSRSRRKTKIFGHTSATSDHQWKKQAARILRHQVKQHLCTTFDGDWFVGKRWDVVNPWDAPKDGKHYRAKANANDMRK